MASTSMMEIPEEGNKTKERDNEIEKLFTITKIIINKLGVGKTKLIEETYGKNIIDIDLSDEISGVLMTV